MTESQASVSTRVSPVELAGCIPAGHITVCIALPRDGDQAHGSGPFRLVLSTKVLGDFLPTQSRSGPSCYAHLAAALSELASTSRSQRTTCALPRSLHCTDDTFP